MRRRSLHKCISIKAKAGRKRRTNCEGNETSERQIKEIRKFNMMQCQIVIIHYTFALNTDL